MSAQIFFYRHILNPVMRRLLRSPLHGIASKNIAILHFLGHKSGKWLDTPLSYMRDGDTVRFLSSQDTRWWMNLRGEHKPVKIEAAQVQHEGTARLLEGDSEALREGVRRFLAAVPRDAKIYGIKLDSERRAVEESLALAAPRLVLVEVGLSS